MAGWCRYPKLSLPYPAGFFFCPETAPKWLKSRLGYEPTAEAFLQEPVQLVFWCGDHGFAIAAQGLRLVTHSGGVALDQVPEVNREWWAYWRRYWDKKDTPEALPKDFACEVTIPLKS